MKTFLTIALLVLPAAGHAAMFDCTKTAETTYSKVTRVVHNWLHPHHRVYPKPVMCGDPDMITVNVEAPPLHDEITPADTSLNVGYMATGGLYGSAVIVTPWSSLPITEPAVWRDARDTVTHEEHKPQCVPEPAEWLVLITGLVAMFAMRRRYVRS